MQQQVTCRYDLKKIKKICLNVKAKNFTKKIIKSNKKNIDLPLLQTIHQSHTLVGSYSIKENLEKRRDGEKMLKCIQSTSTAKKSHVMSNYRDRAHESYHIIESMTKFYLHDIKLSNKNAKMKTGYSNPKGSSCA